MTGDDVIAALDLPTGARVDRRVPKALLVEQGAPTAADKRLISNGIDSVQWIAALKPTTIGVAPHRDDAREYLEVAILSVTLKPQTNVGRLIELVHRAVPYPLFAIAEAQNLVKLSLAHKRWSQSETGIVILDGEVIAVDAPGERDPNASVFAEALAVSRQPRASLLSVYQGWIDTMLALEAARRTGKFEVLPSADRQKERREALQECARLEAEAERLRAAARRERQVARQVEVNLKLKRAEAAHKAALSRL